MAFEFWRCATHGDLTAARDILSMVIGGSSITNQFAFLGQLAYVVEILLAVAMAVMGAVGLLCCFRRNALCAGHAQIDEHCDSLNNERQAQVGEPSKENGEVTIRLDNGHLWLLRGHRCIVTVHAHVKSTQNGGREIWYARGKR
jgi:hypothetical protein